MCAPADTHDSSYSGFFNFIFFGGEPPPEHCESRQIAAHVRARVYFRSVFDVVLRNASFGCTAEPFFN